MFEIHERVICSLIILIQFVIWVIMIFFYITIMHTGLKILSEERVNTLLLYTSVIYIIKPKYPVMMKDSLYSNNF